MLQVPFFFDNCFYLFSVAHLHKSGCFFLFEIKFY